MDITLPLWIITMTSTLPGTFSICIFHLHRFQFCRTFMLLLFLFWLPHRTTVVIWKNCRDNFIDLGLEWKEISTEYEWKTIIEIYFKYSTKTEPIFRAIRSVLGLHSLNDKKLYHQISRCYQVASYDRLWDLTGVCGITAPEAPGKFQGDVIIRTRSLVTSRRPEIKHRIAEWWKIQSYNITFVWYHTNFPILAKPCLLSKTSLDRISLEQPFASWLK